MFANAFFSSFFFPSFFRSFFLLFLEIKHTRLPPHRHYKKPQAGHLTGINKLVQTYHSTGLTQTHKLIATQAAKLQAWHHTDVNNTTRLPPDRQQNYKLAATQAKNYKLTATQAKDYKLAATQATKLQACCHTGTEQNYKPAATQAYHKTTSLLPHRHRTKLQAYSHTGKKLQACRHKGVTQKLQACRHTGNRTTSL